MIYITGDLHGIYDSGKLFKVKYKPDDIIIVLTLYFLTSL